MVAKILSLFKHSVLLRYCFVGGTSYVIELSCLLSLHHYGHLSRTVATAISYWIGLTIAFILQKLVAFQDYRKELNILTKQGLIYGVLTLWNYSFTLVIVSAFSNQDIIFSRTLAQAIFSCWNFFIFKKIIFKKVDIAV